MVRLVQSRPLGAVVALVGATGTFLLMANQAQFMHGALFGLGWMLLCVVGLWWALGLLRPGDGEQQALPPLDLGFATQPDEPGFLAPRAAWPVSVALVVAAWFVGEPASIALLALGLLVLLPAALSRPGLLVFVVVSLLYLPMLGAYGLWDPWETHYGEVAREILARDDWISLWWAQDRWFWSKPILIFWQEALFWSASGVDFLPDTNPEHVGWVLRLPIYLLSISAVLSVYLVVSRFFGARSGVLAALVLSTTPYYGLLSRQAITDLPLVANLTLAVMLLLAAVHTDPEQLARRYRLGPFVLGAQHVVIGLVVLVVLPQALYLWSRNVTLVDGGFVWHADEFMSGSAFNSEVPGNDAARNQRPALRALWAQPAAQALFWLLALGWIVRALSRERRLQPLLMYAFYLVCGLGFMAKGIPGFALPGLVAALYLACFNRWSLLLEGRLKIAMGALTLLTCSLPWFVAMYVRHGSGFTDRILVHDHLNRLTKGVHGDNGTIQYFIWQFGYGFFPWIALAPLALSAWLLGRVRPDAPPQVRVRTELTQLFGLWFAATFTLFSAMTTKFHHYIFPAVPPAAILVGLLLARMLGEEPLWGERAARRRLLAGLLSPVPFVLAVAGLRGDVRGILPAELSMGARAVWVFQHPWPSALCVGLLLLAAGLLWLALRDAPPELDRDPGLAAGLWAGALLAAFVARDLSWTTSKAPPGSARLSHLFIYNYDRPFPEHIDYRAILMGFGTCLCLWVVLAGFLRLRRAASAGLLGLAVAFSAWCLNVYLIDLTPHWSQEGLIKRYYAQRAGPDEPLVAWQMNWKGENLYTGNRVAVFVDLDNKKINKWIEQNEGKRAFFVLEHKRLPRFKSLMGRRKVVELSTERDNNKFLLVKARL